jgi:hypothetical protein
MNFGTYLMTSGAAGDFNHDGHLDLAISGPKDGLYVLWGKGDGTFSSSHISTISLAQVMTADLDHDGFLDLIVASNATLPGFGVFRNQRNGTFSNVRLFDPEINSPAPFALGDFNHDGYLDLVTANTICYGAYGMMFQTPVVTQSLLANAVAVGDFNRDGIQDVASVDASGQVSIFPGSGKGYLNPGPKYSTGVISGEITTGDVNGDGIVDLVVMDGYSFYDHNISVLLGNGDGTFGSPINSFMPGTSSDYNYQFYLTDLNHDGKADLIGWWGVALGHGDGFLQTCSISLRHQVSR